MSTDPKNTYLNSQSPQNPTSPNTDGAPTELTSRYLMGGPEESMHGETRDHAGAPVFVASDPKSTERFVMPRGYRFDLAQSTALGGDRYWTQMYNSDNTDEHGGVLLYANHRQRCLYAYVSDWACILSHAIPEDQLIGRIEDLHFAPVHPTINDNMTTNIRITFPVTGQSIILPDNPMASTAATSGQVVASSSTAVGPSHIGGQNDSGVDYDIPTGSMGNLPQDRDKLGNRVQPRRLYSPQVPKRQSNQLRDLMPPPRRSASGRFSQAENHDSNATLTLGPTSQQQTWNRGHTETGPGTGAHPVTTPFDHLAASNPGTTGLGIMNNTQIGSSVDFFDPFGPIYTPSMQFQPRNPPILPFPASQTPGIDSNTADAALNFQSDSMLMDSSFMNDDVFALEGNSGPSTDFGHTYQTQNLAVSMPFGPAGNVPPFFPSQGASGQLDAHHANLQAPNLARYYPAPNNPNAPPQQLTNYAGPHASSQDALMPTQQDTASVSHYTAQSASFATADQQSVNQASSYEAVHAPTVSAQQSTEHELSASDLEYNPIPQWPDWMTDYHRSDDASDR